jgi:hypothetical protein
MWVGWSKSHIQRVGVGRSMFDVQLLRSLRGRLGGMFGLSVRLRSFSAILRGRERRQDIAWHDDLHGFYYYCMVDLGITLPLNLLIKHGYVTVESQGIHVTLNLGRIKCAIIQQTPNSDCKLSLWVTESTLEGKDLDLDEHQQASPGKCLDNKPC